MSLEIIINEDEKIMVESCDLFTKVKSKTFNLTGSIKMVKQVCDFAEKYSLLDETDKAKYADPKNIEKYDSVNKWHKEFFNIDNSDLFEMANISCELGFNILVEIIAFHISQKIIGKNPQEIRNIFKLPASNQEDDMKSMYDNIW